ncbi:hypothetical protein PaG_05917 [Moesziomyces aphidis]|uniref:rRNA adenine N(6)-methyltransferase n=1 Tax=Moesziomyces aphidis TaxID=84754 RepID=W3VGS6_MOEAP|nr:hypothetical protein PaG_05917 [Moesziomyces aphidis]
MGLVARTASSAVAQLASGLRPSASRNTRRIPKLHTPMTARTLYSSTAVASSSKTSSSSKEQQSSDASDRADEPAPKSKRKRRTSEEVQASRLASKTFGLPVRATRRTRSSIPGAPGHEAGKAHEMVGPSTKSARSAPGKKAAGKKKTADDAKHDERGSELDNPWRDAESIGELLELMSYDHLPPRPEWKKAFPNGKIQQTTYRYFVSNRSTIQQIIPHLGIHDPERNGEEVTIVEGYPGPGTFTSELLKIPEVEKVVALEATPCYVDKLEVLKTQLEQQQPGGGQRLDILQSSAYAWETYGDLIKSGKLAHLNGRVARTDGGTVDFTRDDSIPPDHSDASWKKLSPVIFLAQLPNTVYGEQLFAQIVTGIASRSWLFRHGRIKLAFVCGESLAKRCLAPAGDKMSRGKLGTTVQCLADIEVHRYAHELQPHATHFYPTAMTVGPRVTVSGSSLIPNSNSSTGLTRTGMVMMTVTPKQKPLIKPNEIEAFEYITRNLFILRTKAVGEALTHVAPGAQNVLKMTSPEQVEAKLIKKDEVILPSDIVADLTNVQWACLAKMFEKWPFRPRHLFEEGRIKSDKDRKG